MRREEDNGVTLHGSPLATIPVHSNYTTNVAHHPQTGASHVQNIYQPSVQARTPAFHKKTSVEAYILCLILGVFGAHQFYLRRPGIGLAYLFTFGLLGVGVLVDLFRIPCLVKDANRRAHDPELEKKKRLDDAYVLWMPFGLLGFHHFYLRNHALGVLYLFTFGIFGIGWLLDLFLMPFHVRKSNEQKNTEVKTLANAYLYGVTPLGLCGAHHFYLNRPLWGILYIHTMGLLGVGWIVDWFRMSYLVDRCNKIYLEGDDGKRHLDDAYLIWFPCGLLGFHHFYLNRPGWGILYFFTLGLFGLGWLLDFFRLPCLVQEYNKSTNGRKTIPSRQGMILQAPNGTTGHYVNNASTQHMVYTYGGTQNTYTIQGNHTAPQYAVLNQSGYQHVIYPGQQPLYNGGYFSQDLNPPPYSAVCPNSEAEPLPRKADPS